jgi:DNA-binding GntR family transcriptional regulator
MAMRLVHSSLHQEVADRLRERIFDGEWPPGAFLDEVQLAQELSISRTPLREALKVLAAEGLVQLAPNRGAMIATLGADELEECLAISTALEALSGELACENVTDAEMEKIRTLHAEMIADYEARDFNGYLAKNRQIHGAIVAATHNPLLTGIYDMLFFRVGRCRATMTEQTFERALADHHEIMSALEARDGDRLAGLLKRHLESLFEDYRTALGKR